MSEGAGEARTGKHRPPEMEDWLNRHIYHPAARRLARALAPTALTPNAVSLIGFAAIVAAGLAYLLIPLPIGALVGFLLHASWHVWDGADGDLARLTGKTSPLGEVIDGICDYFGHFCLYGLLAALMDDSIGWVAWPLVIVSGCCRAVQANHCESQRRIYLWRAYGVPWLRQRRPVAGSGLFGRISADLAKAYVKVAEATSPHAGRVEGLVENLRGKGAGEAVKRTGEPLLKLTDWLGSNPRTLFLGIAMAAGSPVWFFILELTVLNLLTLASVQLHRRMNARLEAELEALARAN